MLNPNLRKDAVKAPKEMNETSPLVPQGSFEAQARGKSRVKFAFYTIVIVHVLAIAGFLIIGCKREGRGDSASNATTQTNDLTTPAFGSEPSVLPTAINTNPPPAVASTPASAPAYVATPATPTAPVSPTLTSAPASIDAPAATTEHTIVKNDTLAALASHYKVSLKDLLAANPNLNPAKLQVGDKVKIPAKSATASASNGTTSAGDVALYTVKSGDTLGKIASTHKTTVKELQKLNNLSTTQIKAGQKLKMPLASATPAVSAGTIIPVGTTSPPALAQ